MSGNGPACRPATAAPVTVAALIALYRQNELPFHLKYALQNGLTREELGEAITPPGLLCGVASGRHCGKHRPQGCWRRREPEMPPRERAHVRRPQ